MFYLSQISQRGILLKEILRILTGKFICTFPRNIFTQPVNNNQGLFFCYANDLYRYNVYICLFQRKVIEGPLFLRTDIHGKPLKKERKNFEALFKNSSDAIAIVDNEII
jgi:hypothetical protein